MKQFGGNNKGAIRGEKPNFNHGWTLMEAPSTKFQAPEKFQTANSKA
jgi:hypothetical protein